MTEEVYQIMNNRIEYCSIRDFIGGKEGVVNFGTAPDGLPLLAKINAPPKADGLLYAAAVAMGVETSNLSFAGTPLGPIAKALGDLLKRQFVQRLQCSEASFMEVMILPKQVRLLTGRTLMERLLASNIYNTSMRMANTSIPPDSSAGKDRNATTESLSNIPKPKFIVGETYLAFSTSDNTPVIVRKSIKSSGWPEYSFVRPYIGESTGRITDSNYWNSYDNADDIQVECLEAGDPAKYAERRCAVPGGDWKWTVPRLSVAGIIMELVSGIHSLHKKGEIHGDIKPANVLLTGSGAYPFDSLRLAEGERSPAMTRGWAAPEQILGMPASCRTDQYPIGLMLVNLVQGVLYGEEISISIPAGGTRLERHTVFRNPGVYIDPERAPVKRDYIDQWRSVVENCVRFDQEKRFSSMESLLEQMQILIEKESLTGYVEAPLSFGSLVYGDNGSGKLTPCWLAG